jgi:hypothetical protein
VTFPLLGNLVVEAEISYGLCGELTEDFAAGGYTELVGRSLFSAQYIECALGTWAFSSLFFFFGEGEGEKQPFFQHCKQSKPFEQMVGICGIYP